jgi:hypothetical protein
MKKLTDIEIKNKIVTYLGKKGITITMTEHGNLFWYYKKYYSDFTIRLLLERKKWNDENINLIKYSVNEFSIRGISRRKTSINDGFCLSLYKNLIWIQQQLDTIAENTKIKTDDKIKYCTELEMYYKKIHNNVNISVSKGSNNTYNISISGYNNHNNSVYYTMTYSDNKYYLDYRSENLEKIIEL